MIKCLIGTTKTLTYNFYNKTTGVLSDLTSGVIKIYDYNKTLLSSSTPTKSSTGTYYYNLVVPDNPPYIYVECSGKVDGFDECTRDTIEVIWAEDDFNTDPTISLVVGTNTYIDLDDANTYIDTLLGTDTWDNTSDTDKSKALIAATRSIDRLLLKGSKVYVGQSLAFPRYNISNYQLDYYQTNIPDIPQNVIDATCEEALQILTEYNNPNIRVKMQQDGVKSIKFGDSTESYNGLGGVKRLTSSKALLLMKPYISNIAKVSR